MPILPVHWHEVFRSHQSKHQLEFLLTSVSMHMDGSDPVVQYRSSLTEEIIYRTADRKFVPRNRRSRDDHSIS